MVAFNIIYRCFEKGALTFAICKRLRFSDKIKVGQVVLLCTVLIPFHNKVFYDSVDSFYLEMPKGLNFGLKQSFLQ